MAVYFLGESSKERERTRERREWLLDLHMGWAIWRAKEPSAPPPGASLVFTCPGQPRLPPSPGSWPLLPEVVASLPEESSH